MRKLLSIVLALTLVLGMLPVFANEYAQEGLSPAENLRHYKFIQGDNGDLKLDQTLTRAELATIIARMLGKDEEAKAFEAETSYDDRAKFPKWAKGYISFATAQGLMLGYDNKFDANGTVNSKQAATVFLRLLGYNQGEDFQYKEAVQFLRDKGVEMVEADKILRGDLFNTMWTVVSTEVMKEEGKILGAEHGMLPPPAPKFVPIAIDEVKADNLKEVTVKFNQEIKKDELGTFAIKGKTLSAELMEDGMTVKLSAKEGFDNQKSYKLVIENTAAMNELAGKLAKTEMDVNVFDATLPTVTNVEFSGPKNLVITFSEPMKDVKGEVSIKKGNTTIAVNKSSMMISGNTVLAQTFSTFAEGGEYEIMISEFQDMAGYKNANHKSTYTYTKDTTAPTAKVLTSNSNVVVVEFSKPVKGLKASMFWHSFTAWAPIEILTLDNKAVSDSVVYKHVKVVFYKHPTGRALPEGNVKFGVDGDKIVDLWGNKLGQFEESLTIKSDKENPEVKAVVADGKTNIRVTFTKEVDFKPVHITLKNEKGLMVPFRAPVADADEENTWVIETLTSMEGNTLTLDIKGVQDTTPNMNTVVPYSGNVVFGDKTAPVVKSVAFKLNKDDAMKIVGGELYFFYDNSVDSTALVGANYQAEALGQYTKLSVDGEFFGTQKVVKFTLGAKEATLVNNGGVSIKFIVSNVKDLAGNTIVPTFTTPWVEYDTAVEPKVAANGIVLTSAKTIEVTFNSDVTVLPETAKLNDFFKVNDGAVVEVEAYEQLALNKIKLILKREVTTAANLDANVTLKLEANAVKNQFGVNNKAVGPNASRDMIQPTFDVDNITYTQTAAEAKITLPLTKEIANFDGKYVAANDIKVTVNGVPVSPMDLDVTKGAKQVIVKFVNPASLIEGLHNVTIETIAEPKFLLSQNGVSVKALPLTEKTGEFTYLTIQSVKVDKRQVGGIVTITFSHNVDPTEAEKLTNYVFAAPAVEADEFDGGSGKAKVEDNVVKFKIKTNAIANGTKLTVTNIKVKDVDATKNDLVIFTIDPSEAEAGHNVWKVVNGADADDTPFEFAD